VGMKTRSLRILITDAKQLSALGAIHSLGRAGHTVIAAYRKGLERPASLWSRYCSGSLCYPDPWYNHFEFRDWLRHQTNRGEFDAVLPVTEASVVGVASVRRECPKDCLLVLPSDSALEYTLSKFRATQMGVTLILTLDSLSPFAEGDDVPRQRHRPFVRLAQQRPGAFKALTLTQRPQGENRLPSSCTPAHPRPFQALAHQGFTRGFHDPRANRQVLRSQGCIAHPVAMLTKIGQRFMDSLPTRVARPQATQRSHHGLDSFRRIAQYLA
jgi:hypothetical protein